jgi:hypothetical protein
VFSGEANSYVGERAAPEQHEIVKSEAIDDRLQVTIWVVRIEILAKPACRQSLSAAVEMDQPEPLRKTLHDGLEGLRPLPVELDVVENAQRKAYQGQPLAADRVRNVVTIGSRDVTDGWGVHCRRII